MQKRSSRRLWARLRASRWHRSDGRSESTRGLVSPIACYRHHEIVGPLYAVTPEARASPTAKRADRSVAGREEHKKGITLQPIFDGLWEYECDRQDHLFATRSGVSWRHGSASRRLASCGCSLRQFARPRSRHRSTPRWAGRLPITIPLGKKNKTQKKKTKIGVFNSLASGGPT